MPNNALINQPKMNVFKRIRKSITMRLINKNNYIKLPDYLKNDFDVIDRMMEKDISSIEVLPENLAIEYIERNPKILITRYFEEKNLVSNYIEKKPELFNLLTENQQLEMIIFDQKYQFIKELDEDLQLEFLSKNPNFKMFVLKQKIENNPSMEINEIKEAPAGKSIIDFNINSEFFAKNLNYFSEDVIYNAVRSNLEIVKSFDFSKLPIDTQVNIAHIDNNLLLKMDRNVINTFFGNKKVTLWDISKLNIDDTSRLGLINILEVPINVEQLIRFNYSKELIQALEDSISENDFKSFLIKEIPEDITDINSNRINSINEIISKFSREKVQGVLTDEQKSICTLSKELSENFDEEQIIALFDDRTLEMNFKEKYCLDKDKIKKFLMEISKRDNGLTKLKNYCDFREKKNGLDFCESLYKSVAEYNKYGNLYNDLLNNFSMLSEDEKKDFSSRWSDLINLDNKFNIQNIQDFENADNIEKEYYLNRIDHYGNEYVHIKRDICELLVRNPEIYKITRLGNGTDYTLKNKSLEDLVDLLSTINEITDMEALKGILKDCIEMIGSEELKTIRNIGRNIEEKIAQEYREEYTESFTNYDDMSDEELSKIDGISVRIINGVRIIDLKGADFSFLAHVGGIHGEKNRCCCSLVTNENFSTFQDGLKINGMAYIYSKFNPRRIKFINVGDAGFSDFQNTYISHDDLSLASKKSKKQSINYSEVTLSTTKEYNEEELKVNAYIVTSKAFDESEVEKIGNDDSGPKTIYVLHEGIYNEKNKQYEIEKEELTKKYMKTMDPKFLDLILKEGASDESAQKIIIEVEKAIKEHLDDKFGKNILRKNLSRYWQLSRHKGGPHFYIDDIQKELSQRLESMDNELLGKDGFKDKVREVADKYGEER